MEKFLRFLKVFVLLAALFIFPLFFLPITQEFFSTNKLYLLGFGGLLLLLVSVIELFMSKKIAWHKNPFDRPVILFLLTIGLSILISTPNKIQALLNPNFGFVSILSLSIMYFYLSRFSSLPSFVFNVPSFILSILTMYFFFQPFTSTSLPQSLQFLKNPGFNPVGNQLDLAIILGFFVVYNVLNSINKKAAEKRSVSILGFIILVLNLLALSITVYSLVVQQSNLILPPLTTSWYAAVETLKNPVTALFGVGVDNFASMFTRVKDILYNQSSFWQIGSFTVSRSGVLHILTETGLFGLVAFGLLVVGGLKKVFAEKRLSFEAAGFGFVILMMFLFPPSLPLFFLFFFMLSQVAITSDNRPQVFDLSEIIPLYLGIIIISVILIGAAGYFIGRSYLGEYYFKAGLDGIVQNNIKTLYDNERQAILLNPFIERYRINFAQTNLLIANNIASRAQSTESGQLSSQDRQTIAQAIQAAIAEAKTAVSLNPQKASNWENLAIIYRNILNVAQGADVWTISAYQRAIILDSQNPIYRLNLGGVYYSLNGYDDAIKLFELAVSLKPDWANAHYNLAWASFQKQNYQRAVTEMQTVIALLNPLSDKVDYDKAQKDLVEFKKKLPKAEEVSPPVGGAKPGQLVLPTPQPTIEPKIKLPQTASPEAK